jgi:hypothetical protein
MGHSEHEQLSRAAFGANSQREHKGWPVFPAILPTGRVLIGPKIV